MTTPLTIVQLKECASGLSYLHSQRVAHGDLKGVQLFRVHLSDASLTQLQLNVLINKQRRACLADFGLTRIIAEFTSSGSGKPKGTIVWMSPEVMWPEKFAAKDGRPTMQSDVYSLGILIYEVCASFVVQLQHLRQRSNRSFVGIGLSRNWENGPQCTSYKKGHSQKDPVLGLRIPFGELWKGVCSSRVRSVQPRRPC